MYTASCLCNGVQLIIKQEISKIFICHCKQCQKAQGSAFVAIVPIQVENLEFKKGNELIGEYYATDNKKRTFCKKCAAPLFSARLDFPDVIRLRVGIINESLHVKVYSHSFTNYKVKWLDIPQDGSLCFLGSVQI